MDSFEWVGCGGAVVCVVWHPLSLSLASDALSCWLQVVSWVITIWLFGSFFVFALTRVLGGEVCTCTCVCVCVYVCVCVCVCVCACMLRAETVVHTHTCRFPLSTLTLHTGELLTDTGRCGVLSASGCHHCTSCVIIPPNAHHGDNPTGKAICSSMTTCFSVACVLPGLAHPRPLLPLLQVLGVLWSTFSAGSLLAVEGLRNKKPLLLYPLFLVYVYFLSMYSGV